MLGTRLGCSWVVGKERDLEGVVPLLGPENVAWGHCGGKAEWSQVGDWIELPVSLSLTSHQWCTQASEECHSVLLK